MNEPLPRIPVAQLLASYQEAWRCYPREACGLFFGPRGAEVLDGLRICENDQDRLHALDPAGFHRDGRTAFQLRFADVDWLIGSQKSDAPAQILFHSHIDVGAALSAEDLRDLQANELLREQLDHLVIDVTSAGVRGALRHRFIDGQFRCIGRYDQVGRACEVGRPG